MDSAGASTDLDIFELGIVWIGVEEVFLHANYISAIVSTHLLLEIVEVLSTACAKRENVRFVPFCFEMNSSWLRPPRE